MIAFSLVAMALSSGLFNACLFAIEPNLVFPPNGQEIVHVYSNIDPGIEFTDLIASWNVDLAGDASLKVEVRAHGEGFETKWYTMGLWSLENSVAPRYSIKGQKDDDGVVNTDTLVLTKPARKLDVQVTLRTVGDGPRPTLKLLTFSFSQNQPAPSSNSSMSSAWGKTIDVPERAQGNYPNGGGLCSPTSVSMVLWHYARLLGRPELNKDVPEVEAHVWDPAYKGCGNWPFNMAYAGSFKGMRGYVARFQAISDLEKWTDAGFPVVCSVSFDMLRGLPLSPTESGHLVVLVGFTSSGDPIFNDPAFKNQVRKSYKRADFEKAWVYSKRTVYLVYPESARIPEDRDHLWIPTERPDR